MLVSVVVNNFNYEPFLRESIDSALAQTHPAVQVIVVDDGSTDGSVEAIHSYGHRIVPVLKGNGGQASAFNAGFAVAMGEAVIFLDADDVLEPTAAAAVAELFVEPEVVKVHWPLTIVDHVGRPTGALKPGTAAELPDGDLREAAFRTGPTSFLFPPTSGNAWSRRFLENVLPIPEDVFRLGADTYLFEVAPFSGPVRRWPEPLARYRVHGRNRWRHLDFDEMLGQELAFYDACLPTIVALCDDQGVDVDVDRWRSGSWWHRLARAIATVDAAVPPETPYLLADEASWGLRPSPRRKPSPFPARAGVYWGSPEDDEAAVEALEAARAAGAAAFVLAWPSFWWLEHYLRFADHLRRSYRCVARSDDVVIYDISTERSQR